MLNTTRFPVISGHCLLSKKCQAIQYRKNVQFSFCILTTCHLIYKTHIYRQAIKIQINFFKADLQGMISPLKPAILEPPNMKFSNTYIGLGEPFYEKSNPTPVASPQLFLWNKPLAQQLGFSETLQDDQHALAQYLSGNRILEGAAPIATAYAGHQFGNFNPKLGDGRAHLLGEVVDQTGKGWDIQLKGSGPSAYSRNGDGRCAIGPAVREFIMSEAMNALGVPTTRCLAVVTTGETVQRQHPTPGAIVTRVASSHIRVGSFQFFAAKGDLHSLKALTAYTIQRHFPSILQAQGNQMILLLEQVINAHIKLVVQWMRVGFIHGVMNTDNCAISGETIDYGPCAMMGVYDPKTVYSSIDQWGRYAFGNQASITQWNMARFAECLLQLLPEEDAAAVEQIKALIHDFPNHYQQAYTKMMASKFGFKKVQAQDQELIESLLSQFTKNKIDYTIGFHLLTQSLSDDDAKAEIQQELGPHFKTWQDRLLLQDADTNATQTLMRQHNPVLIPRNHHMEAVIKECEEQGDASFAQTFLEALYNPYQETEHTAKFQTPPLDFDEHYHTFCGT